MYADKFSDFVNSFPLAEVPAAERLCQLVETALNEPLARDYDFEHLLQELSPTSVRGMAFMLSRAHTEGLVKQFIRVFSPTERGKSIDDFDELEDIPSTLEDWRVDDATVRVTREMLKTFYRIGNDTPGG